MKSSCIPVVALPEDLKRRFLKACHRQGRSMADVIRQMVVEFSKGEK